MRLLVDIGNRNLKWNRGAATGEFRTCPDSLKRNLDDNWGGLKWVDCVCIVNVAGDKVEKIVRDWVAKRWGLTPNIIKSQPRQCGVTNGYDDYRELGADRWAALIGARHLVPLPAIVVDCGTAITVDALDSEGLFVGGSIIPGFLTAQQSLWEHAQGIPESPPKEAVVPARTTADAVSSGTVIATAGGVNDLVLHYQYAVCDDQSASLLLTGGDAELLMSLTYYDFKVRPDLVLVGLGIICDEKSAGIDQA